LHESHEKELIKIENIDQILALNNFLTAENKKLRELIDESINSEEIFARVLIDRESPFLKSIVLNRGSKDNVKIGMAIMDRNYLVGQVIEVNYSNSRALLLSDLNSKIPVIVQPPYLQAVASGTGKDYGVIEYTKDEYEENQIENKVIVYTSGLGGLFKPGIPVGKIINNSGQIEFFSDFGQLSFVKIIEFKIGEDK
jgi:rod shape-determining protein MreC